MSGSLFNTPTPTLDKLRGNVLEDAKASRKAAEKKMIEQKFHLLKQHLLQQKADNIHSSLVNCPKGKTLEEESKLIWASAPVLEKLLSTRQEIAHEAEAARSGDIKVFYIYHDPFCYCGMTCWTTILEEPCGYSTVAHTDCTELRPGQTLACISDESPDDIDDLIQEHWDWKRFYVYSDLQALKDDLRKIQPNDPIKLTFVDEYGDVQPNVDIHTFESILERHNAGEDHIV